MGIRSIAIAPVLAAVLVLLPATAVADSAARRDSRNDAPARIDVTRVLYQHRVHRVSTRVRIPELGRTGRVALAISRFDIFEAGYVASVRRRSDGSVSRRLGYFDHFETTPRRCDVGGSWNRARGVVTVTVPRDCLKGHRTPRLYVAARSLHGNSFDDAPAVRRLGRG